MEQEINLPIYYGITEVKIQGGFINNYKEIVIGYIVSKCILVRIIDECVSKEETQSIYEVCFPYTNYEEWNDYSTTTFLLPRKKQDGNWAETCQITQIYSEYEEAKKAAIDKNKHLLARKTADGSINGRKEKAKAEARKLLERAEAFEEWIMQNTEDLEISGAPDSVLLSRQLQKKANTMEK